MNATSSISAAIVVLVLVLVAFAPSSSIDVQKSFLTSASPSEAMRVLSDFRRIPKWNSTVLSVENHFTGQVKEGVRFDEVRKMLSQTSSMSFVVTRAAPTELSVHGEESGKQIDFRFRIEPHPNGSRVSLDYGEGQVNAVLAMALRPLYAMSIAKNMDRLRGMIDRGHE